MSRPIGTNPFSLLQTAVRVTQTVAPKVAQALPESARQAVQDTFERVTRPLMQLGEVLRSQPKQFTVVPAEGLNLRGSPVTGDVAKKLPQGAAVTEQPWPANVPPHPDWMYVSYQDGAQTLHGFVHRGYLQEQTPTAAGSSGGATGTDGTGGDTGELNLVEIDEPEYTDTRTRAEVEAARDTTAATALDWARFMENASNTGYDNWCLDFCINAYNLQNNRQLCPEMTGNAEGNALGAFNALQENGKIRPESGAPNPRQPLEAGTLVFFGPTDKNKNDGHICIATGRMAPDGTPEVITSGFPPDNSGVHYSSVGNLQQLSGPYVGYTTPEIAFEQPATTQG